MPQHDTAPFWGPLGGGFEAGRSILRHSEICLLLPLACVRMLGHILTHDGLNMSNGALRRWAIMHVKKMDQRRKCDEGSSDMTTHEMILPCSSLQGVRTCIPLCLVVDFATFAAFGKSGYPPPAA